MGKNQDINTPKTQEKKPNGNISRECEYEPRHEKTYLRGLRPGKIQTSLLSYRN